MCTWHEERLRPQNLALNLLPPSLSGTGIIKSEELGCRRDVKGEDYLNTIFLNFANKTKFSLFFIHSFEEAFIYRKSPDLLTSGRWVREGCAHM